MSRIGAVSRLARRRPRRLIAGACVVLLVAGIAVLGGFSQSDRPVRTVSVGERIELGRFAYTVHGARVVDRDAEGEPFDGPPLRLLVDVAVVNVSDESAALSSDLIGIRASGDQWYSIDSSSESLHPDLPRRLQVEVPADRASLGTLPGLTDIWLGEQTYGWTNLVNSGPEWSVPHWAGIVADVRVADDRGPR